MSKFLQLENFNLTHFSVQWHDLSPQPKKAKANIQLNSSFLEHESDDMKFAQQVRVQIIPDESSPKYGYEVDTIIKGFFSFPGDIKEPREALEVNGAMILYGILRGLIVSITGSFPKRKLVLPTLDIRSIFQEKALEFNESEKKAGKKPSPRKPVKKAGKKKPVKKTAKKKPVKKVVSKKKKS